MCIGTAAWYHTEYPGLALPKTLSASTLQCVSTMLRWSWWAHTGSLRIQVCSFQTPGFCIFSVVPCTLWVSLLFGVSMSILNASLPLAVSGSQNSFFHWTNEGVGGAALASCNHLGVPLFFYLKVFHFSFEVAITMDQLINSSVGSICEGCLKALTSFCPTLLRAQCNMLLLALVVIVATEPFLWLQQQHTIA